MQRALQSVLLIYEAEPPGPLLVARFSQYDTDFVAAQKLDAKIGLPKLHSYDAILIYTPASLSRGRALANGLSRLCAAPILLIAPVKPSGDALLALQESVHVLLPPGTDPDIVEGHVASLLRCKREHHAGPSEMGAVTRDFYCDETLEVDLVRRRVEVDGRPVHLTPTEFRFMALLVRHTGQLLTYDEILNYVWGWEATEHRIVHTFAAQIRAKLGARGAKYLVNEYGLGYRFSPSA